MPANFEIAFPWIFLLLPLPLLVFWFLPKFRIKSAELLLPSYEKAVEYTGQKPRKSAMVKRRGIIRWSLLSVTWILMLMALSSPQLVGKPEMKVKTSRNFLIVSDISFSMAQKDWYINGQKATRWEAVKDVMHKFIAKREGDRMGLLFFGSGAYVQAPFTSDLITVDKMLEEADVGMAGQMTRIGKAITKGVEMFRRDTIQTKVMLLLTDGVDDGTDILPLDAADQAQKDTVIIYTIGIGDPGTQGSDLDEKTLTEIAELTGGRYFRAKDTERLQEIYTELDKMEPIEYEEMENKPVTLLYYYPLVLAIVLLLIASGIYAVLDMFRIIQKRKDSYVQ